MKLHQYQIDAFTRRVFGGNPAAVCPLDSWLDDASLQAIAAENNLSETAFFVPEGDGYRLRWFAPLGEVDLCGHATLAAAHVLFEILGYSGDRIRFETRSGTLTVRRERDRLVMDFPGQPARVCVPPDSLLGGLKLAPVAVLAAADYMAVYETEQQILALKPDLRELERLDLRGVIVTAPGRDVDFVSRFFGPKFGIPEDPVTGSAHCTLAPYWAQRLNKRRFSARQLSPRGGELECELQGERVLLYGQAVRFMDGVIELPD